MTYIDSKAVLLDFNIVKQSVAFNKKREEEKSSVQTVCRKCKQPGHWALQCPLFSFGKEFIPERPAVVQRDTQSAAQKPGLYRAPQRSMCGDAGPQAAWRGPDSRGGDFKKNDGFGIRITNIADETTEDDLW